MKYQLNIITPLGTLVSEEYDAEVGFGMDEAEASEVSAFYGQIPYGFRTDTGFKAVLGPEVVKNSILLVKELGQETENGND